MRVAVLLDMCIVALFGLALPDVCGRVLTDQTYCTFLSVTYHYMLASHALYFAVCTGCRYSLSVDTSVTSKGSYWGGFTATINGWGFVPTNSSGFEAYKQVTEQMCWRNCLSFFCMLS